MFYEKGNLLNTFVRPQGHTQCISVSSTQCKHKSLVHQKTPQDTFNILTKNATSLIKRIIKVKYHHDISVFICESYICCQSPLIVTHFWHVITNDDWQPLNDIDRSSLQQLELHSLAAQSALQLRILEVLIKLKVLYA